MRACTAFFNKELMESARTYKLFAMVAVFLILGAMSPVLTKLTPVILESFAGDIEISLPEPDAVEAWVQYFQNIGLMGLLTLVIIFSGLTANEVKKGTIVNMLTKGLRRRTVIAAKFSAAGFIWTGCYLLSILASWAYTAYFWESPGYSHVFLAFFTMWLFGILLIALVMLGGILFASVYGGLLFTGGAVMVMSLVNIIPNAAKFNPLSLASDGLYLLTAQKSTGDVIPALSVCAIFIITAITGMVFAFNKKQI